LNVSPVLLQQHALAAGICVDVKHIKITL